MAHYKLKHGIDLLISSLLISILCGLISWLISKWFDIQFSDVLFYFSISIILVGSLSMINGNPSAASLPSLGQSNGQYATNLTFEAIRSQPESADYPKDFKKHSIIKLSIKGITLILGGGFLIIFSILFL